jgi:RNA polymerase sigma factor (sigma-70 family)
MGQFLNPKEVTDAIPQVQNGNVNSYDIIYNITNSSLRSQIGARYGHLGDDFVNEVTNCTHVYVFQNLDKYNPDDSSFQTWMNWVSRNVALTVMTERFNLRKVMNADGRWERVAVSIAMDEEALALVARTVPGPEEIHDAEWQRHLLWQEYDALANDGRLSVTHYDLGDRSLADVARDLGMPVIRLRRLLEKNHRRLRIRLKRAGVRLVEREPHYGRVWQDPDVTWYDDDWTSTQTADLPAEPDSRSGAAAKEIEEEVVQV